MAFIMRNESFLCTNCGENVAKHPTGSARNHCPKCLASLHVDAHFPGDRASSCHGIMLPVGMDQNKKGYIILQRCETCGKENRNIVAPDDEIIPFVRKMHTETPLL